MCLRPCSEDGRVEGEAPAAGEQGEESAGLHVDEEQSEWPESEFMVMEAEASGEGVPGAELCLIMPGLFPGAVPDCAAASCCISAVAFLLLSFLKREVFRDLSPWWWLRRWPPFCPDLLPPAPPLLAILMAWGSLLRPPVLMEVVSRAVALRVTASPPEMSSWRTWVCMRPCTGSPFMWVTRSPGRSPASKAGDPLST